MEEICSRCQSTVIHGQGMVIINGNTEEDHIYCKSCLTEAHHNLSMKKNKKPDEMLLLNKIRKFLNHVKH